MNDRQKAATSMRSEDRAPNWAARNAKAWLDRGTSPGTGYGRAGVCTMAGHAWEGTVNLRRFRNGRPTTATHAGRCERCGASQTIAATEVPYR